MLKLVNNLCIMSKFFKVLDVYFFLPLHTSSTNYFCEQKCPAMASL